MTTNRGRRQDWTLNQWRVRFARLRAEEFTPEEAYAMANWLVKLDSFVLRHMRSDRRALLKQWRKEEMPEDEIAQALERRYIDLGVRGQYVDEEWYVQREGAA